MLKRSSWMSGKAGIMIHYLPPCAEGPNGEKYTSVDDSVDSFDIPAFIERFKKLNAEWLIFTIGQNTGLYNAPNKTFEAQVGPGHCAKRDLVGELAQAIHDCGKRFIAYLPMEMHCNPLRDKCFWVEPTEDRPFSSQKEFQIFWNKVVREWSLRFGKLLDGWFFDGGYCLIQTEEERMELFAAARAGNPGSALSLNYSGFDIWDVPLIHKDEDYFSGETTLLKDGLPLAHWRDRSERCRKYLGLPSSPEASPIHVMYEPAGSTVPGHPEVLMHSLVPIDAFWYRKGNVEWLWDNPDSLYMKHPETLKDGVMEAPMYSRAELERLIHSFCGKGAALTLNLGVFADGSFSEKTMKLIDGLLN